MVMSCCFICVFAVLINKVSLQETVEAVIGGSVLLPCSSTEHDLKLEDTDVSWRHNGSKIVCDLTPYSNLLETQGPQYRNRIETFPLEYEKGNFSIKLTDLTHTDAGKYTCYITPSDEQKTVQLIINESTAEKGNATTDQENQGEESRPDIVEPLSLWVLVCIPLIVIGVIFFIIICLRKNISRCLMSSAHSVGSDAQEVMNPCTHIESVIADNHDESVDK